MDHREQRQVTFFNYLLHKKSSSSGGFAVDLGARWITGKDNSVFSYTKSNGILGDKIKIEDVDAVYNDARFYTSAGRRISDEIAYYGFVSLEKV